MAVNGVNEKRVEHSLKLQTSRIQNSRIEFIYVQRNNDESDNPNVQYKFHFIHKEYHPHIDHNEIDYLKISFLFDLARLGMLCHNCTSLCLCVSVACKHKFCANS